MVLEDLPAIHYWSNDSNITLVALELATLAVITDLMAMGNYIRLGVLGLILILTFLAGSKMKQAQWDRAKVKALELHQQLKDQSEAERKALNEQVFELQISLENEELKATRLNDELQIAINREPVVTTISVSTSDDCPVVKCNIPDVGIHYRLFNCAISNSCETLPDASETNLSNDPVPIANSFTLMDGVYGRIIRDFSF